MCEDPEYKTDVHYKAAQICYLLNFWGQFLKSLDLSDPIHCMLFLLVCTIFYL